MNDTSALPDLHVLAPGLRLNVIPEVDIRKEENGPVDGNRIHNRDSIAGCAKNIAFRFHLNGGIDIAHNDVIGIAPFESADTLHGTAIDQAATSLDVGQHNGTLRIQHFGCFSHEFYATECNYIAFELL